MQGFAFSIIAAISLFCCSCFSRTSPDDATVEELVEKLQSGSRDSKREAAFALSRKVQDDKTRPQVAAAKKALKQLITDKDLYTKIFIAHTLAALGESDDDLLNAYKEASEDKNVWSRTQAMCGIRKNKHLLEKSRALLYKSLDDKERTVVWEGLQSLSTLDSIDRVDILNKVASIAASNSDTPGIQREAIFVLAKAAPSCATHALSLVKELKLHKDVVDDRNKAVKTLTEILSKHK